jgi:uncharacterized SAM-binding protein YcdF (DUF218 family)
MHLHNFSHFMQIWVFPPGLILLLMLIGILFTLAGSAFGKKLSVFTFIIFWFLSSPLGAQALIDGLQKNTVPLDPHDLTPEAQTQIIVLGAGIQGSPEYADKSTLSEKTLARVHYTAYLYKQIHAPILVSGGNRDYFGHSEADLMQSELQNSYSTPVAAVENTSRNTQEQSTLLVPILKANNVRRVYLVTHAWHMPRSLYAFKTAFAKADVIIIPAPMGYIDLKSKDYMYANLLPSLNALNTSAIALHEYIGLAWYHFYNTAQA